MKKTDKVVIGWIDPGTVLSGFVAHVTQLLIHRNDRISDVIVTSGPYLSLNRNQMVATFLQSDADWLLSFDSDVCIGVDDFDKLVEAADENKRPIVGGKYFIPFSGGTELVLAAQTLRPNAELEDSGEWLIDYEQDVIIDNLHSMGSGYVLIHRDVFRAIQSIHPHNPLPWFKDGWNSKWNDWVTEDINFYQNARKLGINIAIHTGAGSKHLKSFAVTETQFLQFRGKVDEDIAAHNERFHNPGAVHKRRTWWSKGKRTQKP
jgi:hypothetical protein